MPQDASVLFEATIKNIGNAASPPQEVIRIWFGVRETPGSEYETVAEAHHTGGLAAGQTVTLQANDGGPSGDGFWFPNSPGEKSLAAIVDDERRVAETEEGNNTRTATIEVETITPVAVANGDYASTPVDTPVIIDVLANDTAPAGYALVVAAVQSPTDRGGTVVITPDRRFVEYTPPAGFRGDDSFTYDNGTVPA